MEIIKTEIAKVRQKVLVELNESIPDEKAFVFQCLNTFFMPRANCKQLLENITDGPSDGGLDFIYFDEDDLKINVCQCKFTENLSNDDVINEFAKIEATINDFRKLNTSHYNQKVKELLQNAMDRFDPNNETIDYNLFTIASLNKDVLQGKIDSLNRGFSSTNTNIFNMEDISNYIFQQSTNVERVSDNFKLKIDSAKNRLEYTTSNTKGAFINVSSDSIKQMFNKYMNRGLLDLNIRKFVPNKGVDSGIKNTLANEREKFWFYNNGITIACDEFEFDGNTVRISNFSIVNGGQTTTLIGKDTNTSPTFYVPCKLISSQGQTNFVEKISEATNSQKPIQPRDLKSNSKEMRILADWLLDYKIILDIKRGEKVKLKTGYRRIRNDELGQLVLSFVYQQPGTSRSGKKSIFDNSETYGKIFRKGYERNADKKAFLLDLIDLDERFTRINEVVKDDDEKLTYKAKIVLKNAKQILFALFGMLYQLENEDISKASLVADPSSILNSEFVYAKFISNYKGDDIDDLIEKLIVSLTILLTEAYEYEENRGDITSVSNLFKRDKKYQEAIISYIISRLHTSIGRDIVDSSIIFKR